MKRKLFSAILAVSVVLLTAGLFACSDDKDDFTYLSCSEAEAIMTNADGSDYMENLGQQCAAEHPIEISQCYASASSEEEFEACIMPILTPCMEKDPKIKQLCGGNSLMECGEHYDTKCGWEDDAGEPEEMKAR